MRRGPTTRRRGFTLFEVMAAVAVLGIIITVLADASVQGMMIEGDADRRLRASLTADDALHELEGLLALGQPIPLGTRESELDEYRIAVTASPFSPDAIGLSFSDPDAGPRERGRAGPSFFEAGPRSAPALLMLEVRVSWLEGIDEVSVTRSSIGFDKAAAAPLLAQIASAQDAERAREDDEDFDESALDEGELDPQDPQIDDRDPS